MTPLVCRYVKTSFVFLRLGVLLGGYIAIEINAAGRGVPWRAAPGENGCPGVPPLSLLALRAWRSRAILRQPEGSR